MRRNFILGVAAATMLLFVPVAESQAQRIGIGFGSGGYGGFGGGYGGYGRSGISIGGNGFSIGNGRTGISFGNGAYGGYGGYGYQPYGFYGNRYYGNNYYGRGYGYGLNNGWGNGYYGNNYYGNQGYSYAQPSVQTYSQPQYQASAPYQGPGVTIHNPSDQTLSFTIDDSRQMQVKAGESVHLADQGRFLITFDRGGDKGQARYTIREGMYDFAGTDNGWELYRQKEGSATDSIARDNRNPDRVQVMRPQIDGAGNPPAGASPVTPPSEASANPPRLDSAPPDNTNVPQ